MTSSIDTHASTLRESLSRVMTIAFDFKGPRVFRTVAEALKAELIPAANIVEDPPAPNAEAGVLRLSLRANAASVENSEEAAAKGWMLLRIGKKGGGELVASQPHLLYTVFCLLKEQWLDEPAALFAEGRRIEVSLPEITARDDLLIGRRGVFEEP